jgi:hypothetical protein
MMVVKSENPLAMFISEILIEHIKEYDLQILEDLKNGKISDIIAIEYNSKISQVLV